MENTNNVKVAPGFESYVGDAPFVYALYSQADAAAVIPMLEALDYYKYNVAYSVCENATQSKRPNALVVFLSANDVENASVSGTVQGACAANIPVVPVYLDDCTASGAFLEMIKDIQALRRSEYDAPQFMNALRARLDALLPAAQPAAAVQSTAAQPVAAPTAVQPTAVNAVYAAPVVHTLPMTAAPVQTKKTLFRKENGSVRIGSVIITVVLGVLVFFGGIIGMGACSQASQYNKAMEMYERGSYYSAKTVFEDLGDYKDSAEMVLECDYAQAKKYYNSENYEAALYIYEELGDYKDCEKRIEKTKYLAAVAEYRDGNYDDARELLEDLDRDYDNVELYLALCDYQDAREDYYDDSAEYYVREAASLFEIISMYQRNTDAQEALSDNYFYFMRVYNAYWYIPEDDDFSFIIATDGISWFFPWEEPAEDNISYDIEDEGKLSFYIDDEFWFAITGFEDNYSIRSNEIYLLGSDYEEYTFEYYGEYDG